MKFLLENQSVNNKSGIPDRNVAMTFFFWSSPENGGKILKLWTETELVCGKDHFFCLPPKFGGTIPKFGLT